MLAANNWWPFWVDVEESVDESFRGSFIDAVDQNSIVAVPHSIKTFHYRIILNQNWPIEDSEVRVGGELTPIGVGFITFSSDRHYFVPQISGVKEINICETFECNKLLSLVRDFLWEVRELWLVFDDEGEVVACEDFGEVEGLDLAKGDGEVGVEGKVDKTLRRGWSIFGGWVGYRREGEEDNKDKQFR